MVFDAREVLKIIGNSLLVVATNLVISNRRKLQYLVLPPYCGFIAKYLPIGIARADVRHVSGEQQDLGFFSRNALRQPFPHTRVGPNFYRRIGEAHVAVAHHMYGRPGRILGNGESGVYIGLLWGFSGCGKQKRACEDGDDQCPRMPPQRFLKWKMHRFSLTSSPWRAQACARKDWENPRTKNRSVHEYVKERPQPLYKGRFQRTCIVDSPIKRHQQLHRLHLRIASREFLCLMNIFICEVFDSMPKDF